MGPLGITQKAENYAKKPQKGPSAVYQLGSMEISSTAALGLSAPTAEKAFIKVRNSVKHGTFTCTAAGKISFRNEIIIAAGKPTVETCKGIEEI